MSEEFGSFNGMTGTVEILSHASFYSYEFFIILHIKLSL